MPESWRYISEAEAAEWLIVNGEDDETMRSLFGTAPEHERGPGRPEIGPAILVRMPPEMIARLEEEAVSAPIYLVPRSSAGCWHASSAQRQAKPKARPEVPK